MVLWLCETKKYLGIGTLKVLTQRAQRSHGVAPSCFLFCISVKQKIKDKQ